MTLLFLAALALLLVVMKLTAIWVRGSWRGLPWQFFLSPLVSPSSPLTPLPDGVASRLAVRTSAFTAVTILAYWVYWNRFVPTGWHPIFFSYTGAVFLWLVGEVFSALTCLLWLVTGKLLPPVLNAPWRARGLADFWRCRWNTWFSDWFRYVVLSRFRRRPELGLMMAFFISGLMHEWVINLCLYLAAGRILWGTMMIYFLGQGVGVLFERRFLRRAGWRRTVFGWLMVLGPAPLILNEGLLRALHLWPF
jgi:hypothetical protein